MTLFGILLILSFVLWALSATPRTGVPEYVSRWSFVVTAVVFVFRLSV